MTINTPSATTQHSATMTQNSASTAGAMLEACASSGSNVLMAARLCPLRFTAPQDVDQSRERKDCRKAKALQDAPDDHTVAARCRVVIAAQQQEMVDEIADAPLRGVHQRKTQCLRFERSTE